MTKTQSPHSAQELPQNDSDRTKNLGSEGELSRQELSELAEVVLEVGQAMLQSGATSFRTEKTMAQVGLGLGADRLELYVTPTGMIATAISGSEQRTRVARVGALGVNMAQILALRKLAMHLMLVGGSLSPVREQLAMIRSRPRELPQWITIPAVGIACGSFAEILGAGTLELVATAVGAGLAQALRMQLHRARVNIFALTVICALTASLITWAVCRAIDSDQIELAVIASVLLLVPGVPLVSSVLDLSNNDLVSGVSRGTLALMLALSIGVGMLLALSITGLRIVP